MGRRGKDWGGEGRTGEEREGLGRRWKDWGGEGHVQDSPEVAC